MELRKVQRTGGGTFFVCLPKAWAEKNRLERSSPVSISEASDGRLIIDANYSAERTPQVVLVRPTPLIDREIVGKYLLGYDIIRVEAKDKISPEERERIRLASSRLIGLEIVEEDYAKIVMQCLLEPSAFPPEKILRREYSIASDMHRDAITALIEGDVRMAKTVIARDNEVNRLYFLLVRILRTVIQNPGLSEKLEILPIDCLDYRLTASLVEGIGDQSVRVAELAAKLERAKVWKQPAQLLLRLHKVAYESHENAMKALFSRNVSLAENVRSDHQRVVDAVHEVEASARTQADVSPLILAAASAVSRIYEHSLDIADLVMPKMS